MKAAEKYEKLNLTKRAEKMALLQQRSVVAGDLLPIITIISATCMVASFTSYERPLQQWICQSRSSQLAAKGLVFVGSLAAAIWYFTLGVYVRTFAFVVAAVSLSACLLDIYTQQAFRYRRTQLIVFRLMASTGT